MKVAVSRAFFIYVITRRKGGSQRSQRLNQKRSGQVILLALLWVLMTGCAAPHPSQANPTTQNDPGAPAEMASNAPAPVPAALAALPVAQSGLLLLDAHILTPAGKEMRESTADLAIFTNGTLDAATTLVAGVMLLENLPPGTWTLKELRRKVRFQETEREYRYFPHNPKRVMVRVGAGQAIYLGRVVATTKRDIPWNGDLPFSMMRAPKLELAALQAFAEASPEHPWAAKLQERIKALGGKPKKKS